MTLDALTARLDAIDDCYNMLFDVYVEHAGFMTPVCKAMFEQLREKLQYSRNITWNDITNILDDMSKQA